ncbi:hypothetical protein CHH69_16945 [Terribacillus saccharophilus]|uniref:DUF3168 domain-containing protein n=1 Tax=Terribacillus saccharophilus TaxID=361277 RepID=UPI000BA57ED7|nr:DUF3168 domain-containing protein [Terribacillus saccharophilus]PAF34217.1 hypothetical protein CHH69_16945 [Terribacillus saccharophilus]
MAELYTSLEPLQKTLYERLSSDPKVNDLVTGVIDYVPEGTAFPYVRFGEPVVTPFFTKTSRGEYVTIIIHVWSKYRGKLETYRILNACLLATRRLLALDGFEVAEQDIDQMQVFDDMDGMTEHGVLRLKYTIIHRR